MKAGLPLLVYLIAAFPLQRALAELGWGMPYLVDLAFAVGVGVWYRERVSSRLVFDARTVASLGLLAVLGYSLSRVVDIIALPSPFNLDDPTVVYFAVLAGPIIEELVYRFAIWELLEELTGNRRLVVVVTAVVFSFAHLYNYWFLPPAMQPYILGQSFVTLFLGLYLGVERARTGSVLNTIALHIAYNSGFFWGALG